MNNIIGIKDRIKSTNYKELLNFDHIQKVYFYCTPGYVGVIDNIRDYIKGEYPDLYVKTVEIFSQQADGMELEFFGVSLIAIEFYVCNRQSDDNKFKICVVGDFNTEDKTYSIIRITHECSDDVVKEI